MPHRDKYSPPPTGRPRGRPTERARVVGPAELEKIAELYLRGQSTNAIGRVLGIQGQAVLYHLNRTIKPAWREACRSDVTREIAKINHIEKTAWERWSQSVQPETALQVRRELESADGHNMALVKKVVQRAVKGKVGEAVWLQTVQWCIEMRCKILGMFAAQRLDVQHGGELRVAGMTPQQLDVTMAERLAKRVAESRTAMREAMVGGVGVEN